jgi:hypothetical protein
MLALRSRFRSDRPTRIEDVEGGLNRMTVKRFENIVNNAAYQVEHKRLVSVKGLPLVTQIPLIRELLTNAAGCVLRVRESQAARPV